MKNMTDSSCELIYRVEENALKKANEKEMVEIGEKILQIEGINRFNQVEQQDSISR